MGERLQQALLLSPFLYGRGLQAVFDGVSVDDVSTDNGRKIAKVSLSKGELPTVRASIDLKTGDILKASYDALWAGPGNIPPPRRSPSTAELSDFACRTRSSARRSPRAWSGCRTSRTSRRRTPWCSQASRRPGSARRPLARVPIQSGDNASRPRPHAQGGWGLERACGHC